MTKSLLFYDQIIFFLMWRILRLSRVKESVADNKHKPKKLWGLLRDLGSSNKCKTKITNIGLKIKETICFDK